MDRRRFGQLFVALVAGRAVAEIAAGTTPFLLLEDQRTNIMDGPGSDFNDAVWTPHPWPASPITEEMFDDATVTFSDEQRERCRRIIFGTGRAEPRGIMSKGDLNA